MSRAVRVILSLCLIVFLSPSAAFADNGTASAPAESGERLATASALLPSAVTSTTGDVKHVVSKTLGTQTRIVPPATDFHEAFGVTQGYPAYDGAFKSKVKAAGEDPAAQAQAVAAENAAILDYTSLDADGNLYKEGKPKEPDADGTTVTKLVRHTAGVSNYGEAVPDDAPSTTKLLSLRMLRYGNLVTGLYAPPGEVVKVTLKSASTATAPEDLGLRALIGNFSGTDSRLAITDTAKFDLVRMPDTGLSLDLSSKVNYIGSPLGGAILIYSSGIGGATVQMEIEGAVEMPTFFYGEMTEDELAEQLAKPAPYFAFSTPRGVRAVGPASLVRDLPASQIMGALEFWDKAIGVSYQFEAGSFDPADPDTNLMVETFDPYIPLDEAFAVNMGTYCVCPPSAGASFFNPETLISQGSWATIHELNHSFPWGGAVDSTQEISNNAINALTYQLYTNIAAARTEPANRADPGSGGLSGWNWCTDLFTTVERLRLNVEHTKSGVNGDYPYARWNLQVYVPLQHAFGADRFLDAVHRYHEKGGAYAKKLSGNALYTNSNVWMRAASEASGYDLGYYMRDVQEFPELGSGDASQTDYITTDVRASLSELGPLYIPSGCLYASGLAYEPSASGTAGAPATVSGTGEIAADAFSAGKDIVEMGRAFRIPYGKSKMLYFNPSTEGGFVSVANGERVEMAGYTAPRHGTLEATDDSLQLRYTPDADHLDDCFYVTLKLTVNDADSPYDGQSQYVTFKVTLLQDTSQTGFTTTFYDWPRTLAAYNEQDDPVQAAIEEGVLDQIPTNTLVKAVTGFDASGQETTGRFAVVEGQIALPHYDNLQFVNLYTRGNVHFSTCIAASVDSLPSVSETKLKVKGNLSSYDTSVANSRCTVLVLPEDMPDDPAYNAYADVVIHDGDPLNVRAYVTMPAGCTCNYRIGYRDEGATIKEFEPAAIAGSAGTTSLVTPALADFTAEKLYSYPDASLLTTMLRSFEQTSRTITCTDAWSAGRAALSTYSGTKANITDGNLATHFHSATSGSDFTAEFVFELDGEDTFNAIRYKGHADFPTRGKFKDYELYVGADRDSVLAAGADSPLLVASGTAQQACDEDPFNYISWREPATGSYVRLVATSSYPFNGQHYYAFSDFTVGSYDSVSGKGTIGTCNRVGSWSDDGSVFTNTRNPLRVSSSGMQWSDFSGTGIIVYATTAPHYGTMQVTIDGETAEVSLRSTGTGAQQPVFWKSGLDPTRSHRIVFKPRTAGSDVVNVDYLEVKGTPDGSEPFATAQKKLTAAVKAGNLVYTGKALKPNVSMTLDGIDVTALCSIGYQNNTAAGTASATASLADDATGKVLSAKASFAIAKATYAKKATVRFSENATSYWYKQISAIPKPQIVDAPASPRTVTFYYSSSKTGSGKPWNTGSMTSSSLKPGTYYLWAVVTKANYNTITTPRVKFTVNKAVSLNAISLKKATTNPTTLQFPKQSAVGAGSASGIKFDVYVRESKTGAKWVKKLGGLTPASMKTKARTISKLSPKKTYQYQVRATRVVGSTTVATSTWTSGKVKTGANVAPKIKSAKTSKARVTKKGKKTHTSYQLKVTLAKAIGNGTVGIKTSGGAFVKGKGKTFTISFKNIAGNKKGKTATIGLWGYTNKTYGGYTKKSNTVKYKIA